MGCVLLFFAVATSTAACGPKRVMVNGVEMTYEEGAQQVYREAKTAQNGGDLVTAKTRFKEVVDLFPESTQVPNALSELSSILYAEGGCPASRVYLERLARDFPTHAGATLAKDRLSSCDGGPPTVEEGPLATFKTEFEGARDDGAQKEVASRAADASLEAGDLTGAAKWLLIVYDLEKDPAQKDAIGKEIEELVDNRLPAAGVRQLLEQRGKGQFPGELLVYKLGRIQYHVRELENASQTFAAYLGDWPSGRFANGAREMIRLIEARRKVTPNHLGVLLPLSGKHASYGKLALQSIQLALGLDEDNRGATNIKLVVRDTKSDRATAAAMVKSMVVEDSVIGILGPIFTYEAEAAAYKAQELGVPLLTISIADQLSDVGPHVFRNGLTNRRQIEALVEHAMDIQGLKTFAILYPRHPYGEELLNLFWDEVEKRKGEIKGVESYGTEDTTFTTQVKRLVARDVLDLRWDYKKALRECDKQPDSYRQARCKERAKKDLKPIVDFDGLFIPDYPKSISMITAALAFEDIIVEQNARRLRIIEKTLGRDVNPVTLLGASGWNSADVTERSGRNVENAIFTDGFFEDADDKATQEFVVAYKKAFRRTPRLYPQALFFDNAKILGKILAEQRPATREDLRAALKRVHDYQGVTGKTSFVKSNDASKSVRILTIKNGKILEVPPPDKTPTAPE